MRDRHKEIEKVVEEIDRTKNLHIRIHTKMLFDDVEKELKKKFKTYVVSSEVANRAHYHIYAQYSEKDSSRFKNLRNYLNVVFGVKGNKDYSITAADDVDKLISYIVKDGDFRYEGFDSDDMIKYEKKSYKKFTKNNFAGELDQIRNKYIEDEYGEKEVIKRFIKLKVDYNQSINLNRIKELVQLWYFKKFPDDIDYVANDVAYNMLVSITYQKDQQKKEKKNVYSEYENIVDYGFDLGGVILK